MFGFDTNLRVVISEDKFSVRYILSKETKETFNTFEELSEKYIIDIDNNVIDKYHFLSKIMFDEFNFSYNFNSILITSKSDIYFRTRIDTTDLYSFLVWNKDFNMLPKSFLKFLKDLEMKVYGVLREEIHDIINNKLTPENRLLLEVM